MKKLNHISLALLLFAVTVNNASGIPIVNPVNGHAYDVVEVPSRINWAPARDAAGASESRGPASCR